MKITMQTHRTTESRKKSVELAVIFLAAIALILGVSEASYVAASPTGSLNQSIATGALTTDVKDDSSVSVSSPSFAMSATTIVNACQTTTSLYGSNTQRIYVDNPGDADNGWTLSIAATDGPGAMWESGADSFDFDDSADSGCENGQLSLDPSVATLTMETGTANNVSQGSAESFDNNSAITLLTAGASSDDIWRGYLTGIEVSQKIPASTPAGSYALDLTQTVINI